jgi:hypothetical protein
MAGAPRTSYDASFPARWVEAMKKPSRAGDKPAKARLRSALKPKGRNAPKPLSNRRSAADDSESEVAQLKRELHEAVEQQTATAFSVPGTPPTFCDVRYSVAGRSRHIASEDWLTPERTLHRHISEQFYTEQREPVCLKCNRGQGCRLRSAVEA